MRRPGAVLDTGGAGSGALWGLASEDLDVNEVAWPAGAGVTEHTNAEVDVLFVVLDGSMTATLDGEAQELSAGQVMVIPKGAARSVTAGPGGVRYLTCHRRRGPLRVT